jgi:hypothetical protein
VGRRGNDCSRVAGRRSIVASAHLPLRVYY